MEKSLNSGEESKEEDSSTQNEAEQKKKDNLPHKGHRKRKKRYLNAIREQMEFYFGDANLSKDRFMMQLISQDSYVPLDVFLTFNKMKNLTSSTKDIAKSLSKSQLLELDEERQKVRRKTAIPTERNVDEKTLYVESLPPTADHDWIRSIFSRFGPITYISLPKYSKSKKIKEFAFIEFEQEAGVEKAVKAFQEFNGVLCMDTTDPAELLSVKSFVREQNEKNESESGKAKKRRINEESTEQPESKRPKVETSDEVTSTTAETDDQTGTGDEGKRRKIRRKKKKKKSLDLEPDSDAAFLELRILPKRNWKRLRNKYLNLQREKTSEFKRLARKNSQIEADSSDRKCQEKPTKKLEQMNMNFYGAGSENDENQVLKFNEKTSDSPQFNLAEQKAPLFSYEPGLIVEINFLQPCTTVKEFKADMRQYDMVKYVDVKEGAVQAHVRLESPQAAAEFIRRIACAEYVCKVLSGDIECKYWDKIKLDREAKLNKKVKVSKTRGRQKIQKVLANHIRFGDDGEE